VATGRTVSVRLVVTLGKSKHVCNDRGLSEGASSTQYSACWLPLTGGDRNIFGLCARPRLGPCTDLKKSCASFAKPRGIFWKQVLTSSSGRRFSGISVERRTVTAVKYHWGLSIRGQNVENEMWGARESKHQVGNARGATLDAVFFFVGSLCATVFVLAD